MSEDDKKDEFTWKEIDEKEFLIWKYLGANVYIPPISEDGVAIMSERHPGWTDSDNDDDCELDKTSLNDESLETEEIEIPDEYFINNWSYKMKQDEFTWKEIEEMASGKHEMLQARIGSSVSYSILEVQRTLKSALESRLRWSEISTKKKELFKLEAKLKEFKATESPALYWWESLAQSEKEHFIRILYDNDDISKVTPDDLKEIEEIKALISDMIENRGEGL